MVRKFRRPLLLVAVFLLGVPAYSRDSREATWSISPFIDFNNSQYVLETPPDKFPFVNPLTGQETFPNGFRLSTQLEYMLYGLRINRGWGSFSFSLEWATTAGRIRSGEARDDDFYGHPFIKTRNNASQPQKDFKDTNFVTTGAHNWSSTFHYLTRNEDQIALGMDYDSDYGRFGLEARYLYWKDRFDGGPGYAISESHPVFLPSPGRVLSLANNQYRLEFTYGYRFQPWNGIVFEPQAGIRIAWTTVTDFHPYRLLHAYSSTLGWGAKLGLDAAYAWENQKIGIAFYQERYYSSGSLEQRGGSDFQTRLANFSTAPVYINTSLRRLRLYYIFEF
ncbi:MAG: putative porin [Leptospiraceae bacterium]|nr:putative porin [Leptospiraceae bacterium]